MKIKKVPTWLSAILVIICAASLCYNIFSAYMLASFSALSACRLIPGILLYLTAIIYGVSGYKKKSALLFRIFCFLCFISNLMLAITIATAVNPTASSILCTVLLAINCVIWLIFTFAKNLGKKRSFILYGISCGLCLVIAILSIIEVPYLWVMYLGIFANLAVFGIMLYGKYVDKDNRGTV